MSSGASAAYEKPRSGRSSCIEETPRSRRIASARDAVVGELRQDGAEIAAQEARVGRWCASRAARSRCGPSGRGRSRSASPLPRRSAVRSAGVPAGAEGRVDDGLARVARREAPHLLGEDGDVVSFPGLQDVRQHPQHLPSTSASSQLPGGAIPDLEVVVDPGDDDVAAEIRMLEQRGRDASPVPGSIRGRLHRRKSGGASAVLPGSAGAGWRGSSSRVSAQPFRRPRVEATSKPRVTTMPSSNAPSEFRRERETVLVIDRVLVFASEHRAALPWFTTAPTIDHFPPQSPLFWPRDAGPESGTAVRGRLRPREACSDVRRSASDSAGSARGSFVKPARSSSARARLRRR